MLEAANMKALSVLIPDAVNRVASHSSSIVNQSPAESAKVRRPHCVPFSKQPAPLSGRGHQSYWGLVGQAPPTHCWVLQEQTDQPLVKWTNSFLTFQTAKSCSMSKSVFC